MRASLVVVVVVLRQVKPSECGWKWNSVVVSGSTSVCVCVMTGESAPEQAWHSYGPHGLSSRG